MALASGHFSPPLDQDECRRFLEIAEIVTAYPPQGKGSSSFSDAIRLPKKRLNQKDMDAPFFADAVGTVVLIVSRTPLEGSRPPRSVEV